MKIPEVIGATLLSIEEARGVDKKILKVSDDWWLRSPGYNDYEAAFVFGEIGNIFDYGSVVVESFGVRPALELSDFTSSDLKVGDQFEFGDYNFTVISNQYALCDDIVGECAFRKDWEAEDANRYETSDVKKFVDDWYEMLKERENGLMVSEKEQELEERE